MNWNIKELKNSVALLFGSEQSDKLAAPLDSIRENFEFSRYHYEEIQRLLRQHMEGKSSARDYFKLVFTKDTNVLDSQDDFKVAYRANVFALLKNLHSVTDFLAHVLYYSFGLNLEKDTQIEPKNLNLFHTKKSLEKASISNDLLINLYELTTHEDYVYLKDLVNYTKHRSNILYDFRYSMKHSGSKIYQFSFLPFSKHESVLVDEYLNREYRRQNELVNKIGRQISCLIEDMLTNNSSRPSTRGIVGLR
ncbi:hypothetical protein P0E95_003402 [Vibrio metschnikovii]|nr:hypothetical protein [Vibrio metschnikovii]EKO3771219.1 hypothetical protein [Vibrio metschnikovii]